MFKYKRWFSNFCNHSEICESYARAIDNTAYNPNERQILDSARELKAQPFVQAGLASVGQKITKAGSRLKVRESDRDSRARAQGWDINRRSVEESGRPWVGEPTKDAPAPDYGPDARAHTPDTTIILTLHRIRFRDRHSIHNIPSAPPFSLIRLTPIGRRAREWIRVTTTAAFRRMETSAAGAFRS